MLTLDYIVVGNRQYFLDMCSEYVLDMYNNNPEKYEVKQPQYKSNAGFSGWVKTISEEFNCSLEVANIWLVEKATGIDCDWIEDNLSQQEISFIAKLGPYSSYKLTSIRKWVELGRPISLGQWTTEHYYFDMCSNKAEYLQLKNICKFMNMGKVADIEGWKTKPLAVIVKEEFQLKNTRLAEKANSAREASILNAFQGQMNLSKWNGDYTVLAFLNAGVSERSILSFMRTSEIIIQNFKQIVLNKHMLTNIAQNDHLCLPQELNDLQYRLEKLSQPEKFNPSYWDGGLSIQSFLNAGVDRKDLVLSLCKVPAGKLDVTKKMVNNVLSVVSLDSPYACVEAEHFLQSDTKGMRFRTLFVGAWAVAHEDWCNKSKTIYGPAGRTALLHNHQLVQKITDDMLVNGLKTSPRVIEELLEAEARRQIELDLGVNVELPVLELEKKLPRDIRQLTCTDDLAKEGEVMNHCVGGYKQACLKKACYIFHVNDGTKLGATVEVSPNPWRVVQSMNYGNSHSAVAKELVEQHVLTNIAKAEKKTQA